MGTLDQEISLNREYRSNSEESLLNLVYTNLCLNKLSTNFFKNQKITDTQFNALMILYDYRKEEVSQAELSERLVTNRASTGELVLRLEKDGFILRQQNPLDKRTKFVRISTKGIKAVEKIIPAYYNLVDQCFYDFSDNDKKMMSTLVEKFRQNIKSITEEFN